MLSSKVAASIQELLSTITVPVYYIDEVPPFDQVKGYDGFVSWDVEEISPYHNTEGLGYTAQLALKFELSITVYAKGIVTRTAIQSEILDIIQPVVSGRRKPLVSHTITNGFIRHLILLSSSEIPVPKYAHSNTEVSASVMTFNCSISITE